MNIHDRQTLHRTLTPEDFKTIELDMCDVDNNIENSPLLPPSRLEVNACVPSERIRGAIGRRGAQLDVIGEYDTFSQQMLVTKADITMQNQNDFPDDPAPPHTILKKDPQIPLWGMYGNGQLLREIQPSEVLGIVLPGFKRPTKAAKRILDQPYPQENVITDILIEQFLKDSSFPTIRKEYEFSGSDLHQSIVFTVEKDKKRTTKRSLGIRDTHTIHGSRYERIMKISSSLPRSKRTMDKSNIKVTWKPLSHSERSLPVIDDPEEYLYTAAEAVKCIQSQIMNSRGL